MGPVIPFESGTIMKDAYDPRAVMRSTVLPPQPLPPSYYYQKPSTVKQERREKRADPELARQTPPLNGVAASRLGPEVAINIDTNPFFMTRVGVGKLESSNDRAVMDVNFLHAKAAQFGGISASAAAAAAADANRKVGAVQYGMTRMY